MAGDDVRQSGEKTLHQQILDDIEGHILSGEWPPGHRIPYEMELVEQYQCSRMTVNKVLTRLANAGLIERRRKAGSTVAQPRAKSAILEIRDIKAEVQSLGLPYAYALLARSRRKARADDRQRLDLPAGATILEIASRHFAGKQPFCFEERLINLAAVPDAAAEPFETIAPGPWLIDRVPWSAAEHAIRSIAADGRIAEALEIPAGAPCLVVERRTWSGDRPITHVRLIYPGERHSLIAHFAPTDIGEKVSSV